MRQRTSKATYGAFSIVLGVLLLSTPGWAQEVGAGWRECRASPSGSAVVRGRLLPQESDVEVSRTVRLTERDGSFSCAVRASEDGVFELRGVPAGTLELTVGGGSIAEMAPILVQLADETLAELAIPIRRDDSLTRCMTLQWCVSVLTRRTSAELSGPEERELKLLGYRLAIVMSQRDKTFGEDSVVCVQDSEEVVAPLREVFPNVAPAAECEYRDTRTEGTSRPMLRHLPSDRPARFIGVDQVGEVTGGEVHLSISYLVAPLWAAGFDCSLRTVSGIWVPESCTMTWIS